MERAFPSADGRRPYGGTNATRAEIGVTSKNVDDIITELKSGSLKNIAERSGRMQDGKHGLEELRRKGYM